MEACNSLGHHEIGEMDLVFLPDSFRSVMSMSAIERMMYGGLSGPRHPTKQSRLSQQREEKDLIKHPDRTSPLYCSWTWVTRY